MGTDIMISRFGNALGGLETSITLIDAPSDWLHANASGIRTATKDFSQLSEDEYAGFDSLLCPRFFLYTLAHLKLCTDSPRALESLKGKFSKWLSVDEVSQFVHYHSINDTIWGSFNRLCIAARILVVLNDPPQRQLFLNQRKQKAQALIDLLQAVLDLPDLGAIRSTIIMAAIDLSQSHDIHPHCLDIKGVQFEGQVAGGHFGDIWQGKVGGHAIAIKVARNISADETKVLSKQAVLWRQFSNPRVLPFYGVFQWPENHPRPCLVSPWMVNGNILQYLESNPQGDRRSLVLDVARGLEYLHTFDPSIIHGNLKGANVLVTSSFRACITGFSFCIPAHVSSVKSELTAGANRNAALRWMAPELLRYQEVGQENEHKTLASDVYAFACVCYEIYAGRPRFSELSAFQTILVVMEDRRPPRPTNHDLDDSMWDLINRCWQMDPASRPATSDVVHALVSHQNAPEREESTSDWDGDLLSRLRAPLLNDPSSTRHTAENVGAAESSQVPPTSSAGIGDPSISRVREPPPLIDQPHVRGVTVDNETLGSRNIVIFGEAGVGKSSLVNLIVGSDVAQTSSGSFACTLDVRDYDVRMDSHVYRIFDTVGLNEPQEFGHGKRYLDSIDKAYRLVTSLRAAGGIHLLVFCMRGGRITDNARQNYALFCDFLCDKKVPVVVAITNLEYTTPMEKWWEDNHHVLEKYGIRSVAHACITTKPGITRKRAGGEDGAIQLQEVDVGHQQKYEESKEKVHDLLREHGHGAPFIMESAAWTATIARKLLDLLESIHIRPPRHSTKGIVNFLTKNDIMAKEEAEAIALRIRKVDADTESIVRSMFPWF
ncbi:kinase-like protein [Leucogyrophana mollusca]|uniref:Kinase-like protein n=1 Tax=Leucogyrophana mollusca TaxID=85980 RepID=A0ACB8B1Y9_9AGAM|nr:kinase-like protein [Leucogyrophana mollusca]